MNKRQSILLLILTLGFLSSCTEIQEEMDPWETEMAKELQAENVQLSHISNSSTINGIPSEKESYLQLEITNSKTLEKIEHNKRLLDKKSEELKTIILDLPEITTFPTFNEVRLSIIKKKGFFPFETQSANTITMRVY
jgi:hypothetical protein